MFRVLPLTMNNSDFVTVPRRYVCEYGLTVVTSTMGNVKIGPAETRQRSPSGWPYIPNATLPVRPKPQAGVLREGRIPTGRRGAGPKGDQIP